MKRHGVGFVDCGWVVNTHHVKAWRGIRDADITAICDIHEKRAKSATALCMQLNVGDPKVCTDASKMAADPHVDAIWITVPNYARANTCCQGSDRSCAGNLEPQRNSGTIS